MSHSHIPKYVVVFDGKAHEPMAWRVTDHGNADDKNLERFVMAYAKSLETGGANAHISDRLGYIPYPRKAEIRLNFTCGATVAEWKAGAFQVYG